MNSLIIRVSTIDGTENVDLTEEMIELFSKEELQSLLAVFADNSTRNISELPPGTKHPFLIIEHATIEEIQSVLNKRNGINKKLKEEEDRLIDTVLATEDTLLLSEREHENVLDGERIKLNGFYVKDCLGDTKIPWGNKKLREFNHQLTRKAAELTQASLDIAIAKNKKEKEDLQLLFRAFCKEKGDAVINQ